MTTTTYEAHLVELSEGMARAVLAMRSTPRIGSRMVWHTFQVWRQGRSTLKLVREIRDRVKQLSTPVPEDSGAVLGALFTSVLEMESRMAGNVADLRTLFPATWISGPLTRPLESALEGLHEVADALENLVLSLPSNQEAHLAELSAMRTSESTAASWRDELAACLQD